MMGLADNYFFVLYDLMKGHILTVCLQLRINHTERAPSKRRWKKKKPVQPAQRPDAEVSGGKSCIRLTVLTLISKRSITPRSLSDVSDSHQRRLQTSTLRCDWLMFRLSSRTISTGGIITLLCLITAGPISMLPLWLLWRWSIFALETNNRTDSCVRAVTDSSCDKCVHLHQNTRSKGRISHCYCCYWVLSN